MNESVQTERENRDSCSRGSAFLLGISLCMVVASFIFFLLFLNNPVRTVERYFDAVAEKDWDTVYSMLELQDYGQFLNKDSYIAVMEEQYIDIDSYEIKKSGDTIYEMIFVVDGTQYRSSVVTVEQPQKEMLLFRKYKIQPIDLVVENIWIKVPQDIQIALNGIMLGDEYLLDSETISIQSYEKIYCIPQLYIGTYVVGVSGPRYQACTEEFSVNSNEQIIVPELPYLREDVANTVMEKAQEETNQYYETLMMSMNSDSCLTDVYLSDIQTQIEDYGYFGECFFVTISMNYHVDARRITKLTDEYTQVSFYQDEDLSYQEEKKYSFRDDGVNWMLYSE